MSVEAGAPHSGIDQITFRAIARIAFEDAGIALMQEKACMVHSRLSRRLHALRIPDYPTYLRYVDSADGAAERQNLISVLTTHVSQFLREKHHFDLLRDMILPDLVARARAGGRIRIWSAGCAMGQEPYSIAMMLLDALPDAGHRNVKILATDIDGKIIGAARAACYSTPALAPLPAAWRMRYCHATDGGQRLCAEVRSLVTFRTHNLHSSWPMKVPLDLIFCRNVLIYFTAAARIRLIDRFSRVLSPRGTLFLGLAEAVPGGLGSAFSSIGVTAYRRNGGGIA